MLRYDRLGSMKSLLGKEEMIDDWLDRREAFSERRRCILIYNRTS